MHAAVHIEYNEKGVLVWVDSLPGAFTRGQTKEEALRKIPAEVACYLCWQEDRPFLDSVDVEILDETYSDLPVEEADSALIFESETELTEETYAAWKALAQKSAEDFQRLYDSIPDPEKTCIPARRTFYGPVPRTATEMYRHVNNCTAYYLENVGISFENTENIVENRIRALCALRPSSDRFFCEQDREWWTVKKVLRRLIWHDRIHAKAMYRMATALYGTTTVLNPFCFQGKSDRVVLPISAALQELRFHALREQIPVTQDATLALLCKQAQQSKHILEIGSAVGLSAIAMAECSSADILTIEKRSDFACIARENFKQFGLQERISLLEGDAGELLNTLDKSFDLIFLDGPKAQYIHYLPTLKKLLRAGGVLFADDVLLYGWVSGEHAVPQKRRSLVERIRDYLQAVQNDPDFETVVYTIGEGVALSRKRR